MKYLDLVNIYEELGGTTKRLEKTHIISQFLKKIPSEKLPMITILLQGRLFPQYDERKIGVAARLVVKAIQVSTGRSENKIEAEWKKTGDLGIVTKNLSENKQQQTFFSEDLSVAKVFTNLRRLCELEGAGTMDRKVKLIAELLGSAGPQEAMYIVRTVLEDLRLGTGEGVIRESLVWAYLPEAGLEFSEGKLIVEDREKYNAIAGGVQDAYDLTLDYGKVAQILSKSGLKGLAKLDLSVFRPLKVMLYQKADDIEDAFDKIGSPAYFEFKYDGFRLQIHKNGSKVSLFTRSQENVTSQFPDVVESVKAHVSATSAILDGEAVGYDPKTRKYLAFQSVSQRIKRKHDINEMAKRFPVEVNIFDCLYIDGKNMLKKPFSQRREAIEKSVKNTAGLIKVSEMIITDSKKAAEAFYKKALSEGNEGIMAKKSNAVYKPGSRVGFGVKVKPVMDSLDLIIVASEWGEGKRSGWLTSFTLACIDENSDLLEVGRVSTGLKELESEGTSYKEMTELIRPIITSEQGRTVTVKPELVIEVHYEEIQASGKYDSGYALRFPRFIRLRQDRSVQDIDSQDTIKALFLKQRNRNS